jgi:hypothetical protein
MGKSKSEGHDHHMLYSKKSELVQLHSHGGSSPNGADNGTGKGKQHSDKKLCVQKRYIYQTEHPTRWSERKFI